jgi:hypothetical protein
VTEIRPRRRPRGHDLITPSRASARSWLSERSGPRIGILTPVGGSPFADNQTAPCWVEINHDGRYLFTVNTASKTISSYSIAAGGSLALLQSTPQLSAPVTSPEDARSGPVGAAPNGIVVT